MSAVAFAVDRSPSTRAGHACDRFALERPPISSHTGPAWVPGNADPPMAVVAALTIAVDFTGLGQEPLDEDLGRVVPVPRQLCSGGAHCSGRPESMIRPGGKPADAPPSRRALKVLRMRSRWNRRNRAPGFRAIRHIWVVSLGRGTVVPRRHGRRVGRRGHDRRRARGRIVARVRVIVWVSSVRHAPSEPQPQAPQDRAADVPSPTAVQGAATAPAPACVREASMPSTLPNDGQGEARTDHEDAEDDAKLC